MLSQLALNPWQSSWGRILGSRPAHHQEELQMLKWYVNLTTYSIGTVHISHMYNVSQFWEFPDLISFTNMVKFDLIDFSFHIFGTHKLQKNPLEMTWVWLMLRIQVVQRPIDDIWPKICPIMLHGIIARQCKIYSLPCNVSLTHIW